VQKSFKNLILLLLIFSAAIIPCFAQKDSLVNKNIYSFGLFVNSSQTLRLQYFTNSFFNNLVHGTNADQLGIKLIKYPNEMGYGEFGMSLGWKIKKHHTKILRFTEYGTGLSYQFGRSGFAWGAGKAAPGNYKVDTFKLIGPFNTDGVQWTNRIMFHSNSFLKNFATALGIETGIFWGRMGANQNEVFIKDFHADPSETYNVRYTLGSFYSLGFPLHLKYNVSCELNIELCYKPCSYFFGNAVTKPKEWTFNNQLGVLLRYKLDTNPASSNNKRTDMFF
jgi:hypothetical protein